MAVLAFVAATALVAGSMSHWFGLRADPQQSVALAECQQRVRHQLTVPSSARFADVDVAKSLMSEDDDVALGFDSKNVEAVWAVTGALESVNGSGVAGRSQFNCRAYFFREAPVRTSVEYRDVDESGQRTLDVG